MSRRNYNAFIRAARKTGGLSLPAARKTYRVMTERLGAPAKGINVKSNPVIFRQSATKSITAREARKVVASGAKKGIAASIARSKVKSLDLGRMSEKPKPAKGGGRKGPTLPERETRRVVKVREIQSLDEYVALRGEGLSDDFVEYAATQNYKGKKS